MNVTTSHQHLSHEQICDLLLSEAAPTSTAALPNPLNSPDALATANALTKTNAPDADSEAYRDHLQSCLICSSELELLRSSVTGFRAVSYTVAERALARRPRQTAFSPLHPRRSGWSLSPAFFWAATALLCLTAIPLGLYHENLNPFLQHHVRNHSEATTATAAPATPPASTLESDEALLEGINQDLSASIPTPMQSLADSSNSSAESDSQTSSPQNVKRNN